MLAYDGVAMFEFAVALKVFGSTEVEDLGLPWYELLVCGESADVRCDDGLRLTVPRRLASIRRADTVIVPPCDRPDEVSPAVLRAIGRAHERGARIASLCTGAFVLARTGLLDGRRAATHWLESNELSRRHPTVHVDPQVLYVDDGDILTSAGSSASLDLCLHLVRLDLGAEVANRLGRLLVVQPHREGGQAQFIETPIPVHDSAELLTDTTTWMSAHLAQELSVPELAARAAMSPRSFARHFLATTGETPYQWVLRERVALARRLLETTDLSVDAVAERAGLGNATNLRKQFRRRVGTAPSDYRTTFRSA
jgi:transcriptional regulator GlxA family with amidase domain